MGKKEAVTAAAATATAAKAEAVLDLLRKQSPLSVKQEKFCNNACVERFLKAKGDSVKKAAKHLRACLSWRDTFATDNLIADEFSAELAEGIAYVAGHDDESRPVMMFRIKQDYQKFHSQKVFTRLLVFTLEVAIGTMTKNVEQFVLLFDASFFRSASAFMNLLVSSLKIVGDYYPGMLFKAFVIDPPSLFSYLWKGVRPFVELSALTNVVSSLEFEDSLGFSDLASYPRDCSSLRFEPNTTKSSSKVGSCSSSRFSFTVSHHLDSLKPWYLTLTSEPPSGAKVGPSAPYPLGPALISPLNARSLSFASPGARTPRGGTDAPRGYNRKSLFPSTPLPKRPANMGMTPKPSFLQSPAAFFMRKESSHVSKAEKCREKCRESFGPFAKFYRRPYDEMIYRSKMRPPLGGLISIVSPHIRRRHHMSVSQRF